jgi:IS605 OrfB family transposase
MPPSLPQTYVTTVENRWVNAFFSDMAAMSREAKIDCLKLLLEGRLGKSELNTHLQKTFSINKRQANSIIAYTGGEVDSAKECLKLHIEQLQGKLKHVSGVIKSLENKLKGHRAYLKAATAIQVGTRKKLPKSLSPKCPDACPIHCGHKLTHYQFAQVKLHQKKRYAHKLEQQIGHLQTAPLCVNLGNLSTVEMVGSKDESYGNQICQLDLPGKQLMVRTPYHLESRYGKYVTFPIHLPKHGQDELATAWWNKQAITYRFIQKSLREWEIHITVSVEAKPIRTQPVQYGAIGIDLNAASIGYAIADTDGNLAGQGQIKLNLLSQPTGRTEAQLVDAVTQLVTLAQTYNCPIVVEKLDFTEKKRQLRETASRYNRMLSGFAYSKFYALLKSRCFKLGIQLIVVNPAYSSVIGLIKFMSLYGMNSATAAALVLARRAMRLSERLPTKTAYQGTAPRKHVWSHWQMISKRVKGSRRHSFFQPKLTASRSSSPVQFTLTAASP